MKLLILNAHMKEKEREVTVKSNSPQDRINALVTVTTNIPTEFVIGQI